VKTTRAFLVAAAMAAGLAPPASAGGGNVLPATARPKGYSLADMAEATAVFNTGPRTTEPDTPFQVLFLTSGNTNTFVVRPGTLFYVPIAYVDDSPPILGDFPDVTDPEAVADYIFDQDQIGAVFLDIEVDGQVTSIGPNYVVGVETPPLPDGGGTHYITPAVFLTPLSKGAHTVTIRGLFTGAALAGFFPGGVDAFEFTYTVIVR
jgi:hypothetical protein